MKKGKHETTLVRRIAALLLDYLAILAWIAILLVATVTIDFALFGRIPDLLGDVGIAASEAIGFTCLTLPVGLYLFLTESGSAQATWGKRRMRLSVPRGRQCAIPLPGAPADRHQTAAMGVRPLLCVPGRLVLDSRRRTRRAGWIAAGLTAANIIPVFSLAMVILTPSRQGPHDFAAGTRVSWTPNDDRGPARQSQ
ncbi:RDD family protein [Glaciihabitans sp. UYNi722]|uniref:RDD family protein n=1 Tax=Glaciihabitans sp. UYNi722 TaxID=3156344 RepID=UPI0033978804